MSNWIAHFSLDILGERSVSVHQYPPRTARISRRIRWGDDSKDVVSRAWRKLKGDWVALYELIYGSRMVDYWYCHISLSWLASAAQSP